jgi:hypothetical protein
MTLYKYKIRVKLNDIIMMTRLKIGCNMLYIKIVNYNKMFI